VAVGPGGAAALAGGCLVATSWRGGGMEGRRPEEAAALGGGGLEGRRLGEAAAWRGGGLGAAARRRRS
jgi:hypothetical protein